MILSMIGVSLITGWRGHFKNQSSLAHSRSMRHSYALLITGRRDHFEKSEASRRNVRPCKNKRDDESRIKQHPRNIRTRNGHDTTSMSTLRYQNSHNLSPPSVNWITHTEKESKELATAAQATQPSNVT
jgi:hypothetical protein